VADFFIETDCNLIDPQWCKPLAFGSRNPILGAMNCTCHRSWLLALVGGALFCIGHHAFAQMPDSLDDSTFWQLVQSLSEADGQFAPQYMSNEDSLQFVLPELVTRVPPGGVYIGVGSEQNFTYMAALRPSLAFIVDIRRDNLRQVLLYKALFEIAPDRATFVSRLFSRHAVAGTGTDASVDALFAAFAGRPADPELFAETRAAVLARLVDSHGLALDATDIEGIVRMLEVMRDAGPDGLQGFGDRTNPTYARLMAATDLDGRAWGFLASEENYGVNRELNQRNLVVPVVGDFAGDVALAGIGRFLDERQALVRVFYVSNVERYLWEQGEHGLKFYANLAQLPHDSQSLFIRSVTSDISIRLGIPIPDQPVKWRTFVASIAEDLDGVDSGRIASYRDLFVR
jgi:hypothetical protein